MFPGKEHPPNKRLPVVLSGEEFVQFLEAVPEQRNRVALTTAYSAGMRVGEVVRLQTTSVDSSRMLIRIEQGILASLPFRDAR
jgi:site-specific recombinase XerD